MIVHPFVCPRLLPQHNEYVYQQLLGIPEEEYI